MSPWTRLRHWLRGRAQLLRESRRGRHRLALDFLEDRVVLSSSLPHGPVAQGASSDFRGIIGLPQTEASYPYRGDGYSVAILDTGIDYNLPDLGGGWGHRVIAGYNFVNNTADPMDDNGHGTFIAGEIASSSTDYPGIAPNVNLIDLKVLDASNQGTWSNIDTGLQWVINHQAQYHIVAVNLSLGSGNYATNPYNFLENDFIRLKNQGVFIAVAAGNNFATDGSQPGLAYPAVSPNVVSVGATWAGSYGAVQFYGATDNTTAPSQLADFTQRDSALSLLAPGAWITSDKRGGGYTQYGGTSMSTAVVTGASVLLHQALDAGGLSAHANQDYILGLMRSTGLPVTDKNSGTSVVPTGLTFRQLDLKAALDAVPRPLTFAPIADRTMPAGGSVIVPLAVTEPNNATVTFSVRVVDNAAVAWQLNQQLGLSTTGSYYTNLDGQNEKWLVDKSGHWYWLLPDGEFRRWGGTVAATLLPVNLVATLDPSYWADPRKLWYAVYEGFPPITLSVMGNQLAVHATSPTWTGPVLIEVTASDGAFTVKQTFRVTVERTAAAILPPVIAPVANRTVLHGQRSLLVDLSASDPQGRPITFSAQVVPAGSHVPPVGVSLKGAQLSLTPDLSFVGTCTVLITASNGAASATATFTVTVINTPPQLTAVAAQTMAPGQTNLTVALSATDADGDAVKFSARAVQSDGLLYQLQRQFGFRRYNGSYYTNLWGFGEKWLFGANSAWYCLLPGGALYRWAGTMARTLQSANLVATLDPIVYTEPRLLWDARPPVAPAITAIVHGNQLTLQRSASLNGVYLIEVTASDGATTSTRTFLLTLN
jgi:hypothetical protein